MQKKQWKPTVKQQKFIDAYEGNATKAAKKAGYIGTDGYLRLVGHRLITNANIFALIEKRLKAEKSALVADRTEREERLSAILRNDRAVKVFNPKLLTEEFKTEVETKEIIKAIDTLNKMDGLYVTKVKLEEPHEAWLKLLEDE